MELNLKYLPHYASEWDVDRAIAEVLHSTDFDPNASDPDCRVNFLVNLKRHERMGVRNDGTGKVTLPTEETGWKFLRFIKNKPVIVRVRQKNDDGTGEEKKKITIFKGSVLPPEHRRLTLSRTRYTSPDIEEQRAKIIEKVQDPLRVNVIQFGVLYRPSYPRKGSNDVLKSRCFSVEWEREYHKKSTAWLRFQYDHKLIEIELGDPMTDQTGYTVAINFASIVRMAIGYDGNPYIIFELSSPVVLEQKDFNRTLTGENSVDFRKYKHRIGTLGNGHERVSPYAQTVRLLLYDDRNDEVLDQFTNLCRWVGIAPRIIRCSSPPYHIPEIEASRQEFFTSKKLHLIQKEIKLFTWPVAFQLELLLYNCLLHSTDLAALMKKIRPLCDHYSDNKCAYIAQLLKNFARELTERPTNSRESPLDCFDRLHTLFVPEKPVVDGHFLCCHVTVAPTRYILEGPYPTQSNRIIRRYRGYEENFIRVDFRDEDRLAYRWDREVDGTSFLTSRVGGILKNGIEIGGKYFQFLAYSNSALREHAVWFVNSFHHPVEGLVTPEQIRQSIGDFHGTDLVKCPSKYAARIAQAFTATDPSVRIHRSQWEEVPDLGPHPYEFTDGCGTISQQLGNEIWEALCRQKPGRRKNSITPSAYQIRFLGFKGMVSVDKELDKRPDGIKMRLRTSMKKFENSSMEIADIEIANSFERPLSSYLNRPLVTILEDKGVRKDAFIALQDDAVAEAKTIHDTMTKFASTMQSHSLGYCYRLSLVLNRLESLGLELNDANQRRSLEDPFLRQVRQVAMTAILRDIKHSARIRIPDSYLLVGVADEGPAYVEAGHTNVFCLEAGQIFACVQNLGDAEPTWLAGSCTISRSPVAHPGDVQRVHAIGKPPDGMLCLFAHLRNVVVLPSQGERSLASQLGGGDLDGDLYDIIMHTPLLATRYDRAASYIGAGTFTLKEDCTADDICNFVVEYINSDLLGLLSDRLLIVADQSKSGIYDPDCLKLAQLCSQAVDYPKQGIPVDLDSDQLPRTLIRCKPDWHAAEVVSPRDTDYYKSTRALGEMFRKINLDPPPKPLEETGRQVDTAFDPITSALQPYISQFFQDPRPSYEIESVVFVKYVEELRYISLTHTLTNTPGVNLLEAEIVAGTILAQCSQKRWRKDRIRRMTLHTLSLVGEVSKKLVGEIDEDEDEKYDMLRDALERSWFGWKLSLKRGGAFGAHSFGLIALGCVLDCLEQLGVQFRVPKGANKHPLTARDLEVDDDDGDDMADI